MTLVKVACGVKASQKMITIASGATHEPGLVVMTSVYKRLGNVPKQLGDECIEGDRNILKIGEQVTET